MSKYEFPKNFIWGSATAAFQIEGSPEADGKGSSIWDEFTKNKTNIKDSSNADSACDHYRLYKNDIASMKKLNLNGYRFSISWTRIFPDGSGDINNKGLDFYDRLTDELLKNGITPFPTLFHWDLPLELEKKGGLLNKDTAYSFSKYASLLAQKLGDRIQYWTTLNEPFSYIQHGYLTGIHAPGKKSFAQSLIAAHNLNLCHGLAYDEIKSCNQDLEIGSVNIITPVHSSGPENENALIMANAYLNELFLDPIYLGCYPEFIEQSMKSLNPEYKTEDLNNIEKRSDFLGLNNYFRVFARPAEDPQMPFEFYHSEEKGIERTEMGWEIYPEGIYEAIMWATKRYRTPPIYIAENGASFKDKLVKGRIRDKERISFLEKYILEVWKSLRDGADVKAYLVWTLLDNFEWAEGLAKRFGIIYVDFETQKRYIKDSGKWYSKIASSNSLFIDPN